MEKNRLPIGVSDFRKLRENNYYYVDKSHFIREIVEASAEIILLPRPRRFGKTLNLNMLKVFFEKNKTDAAALFKDLLIKESPCFNEYHGKYPVIFLTLKDVKHANWFQCCKNLKSIIYKEYSRHRYLLDGDLLFPEEKTLFENMLQGTADITDHEKSLLVLSEFLYRYYNQPVVILIDEYDTPLHAGYTNGYYEEIIGFMRNFLSGGLKDNPHLFKGVLTGILRVAKESIFSGLNNLGVYTILDEEFSDSFGFTEDDTRRLLCEYEILDRFDEVSRWYDGYLFGGVTIYNPWSIVNYANSKSGTLKPFWINTADTSIIDRLATAGGKEIREEIGQLLEGKSIERPVYETIVMRDLDLRDDLLWSFLLFSGYLKSVGNAVYRNLYQLAIPNEEVKLAYEELVIRWFSEKIASNCLLEMLGALSSSNMDLFERLLRKIINQVMSFHDFGNDPEKVYHALVLGMLVWLGGKYDIRSNRESGYGRYDIMLNPKDPRGTGIIIEFKLVEKKAENAHEQVLENALKQIKDRGYAVELQASGVRNILEIAVAFKGKQFWLKHRVTG